MSGTFERRMPPRQLVFHCGGFTRVLPLDEDGKIVPQTEPLKCPLPSDKLVFAPSPQIENLFDPEPYRIALATDLSSFTQVFMYTLFRAREVADVMSHAEHIIYRNMLEADPYKLRANRRTQVRDVRLAIPLIQRHHRFTAPVFRAGEYAEWKAHERFGDIVSVMQWIHSVLQVNEYQTFRHRWPGSAEPHETDPERVEVDYAHYMGEFCEIAEDYDLVQARRKEEAEILFEKRLERARKEMEEREERGDQAERVTVPVCGMCSPV